ncbi:MAG: hypothetical protein IPQ05_17695 [Leptospiraceae bacterium]|jgi:hypothetical protein|nr:hypothetical protein [Leptospiraceae bacterium]MBL0265642.1 hypothetical protein [Leptospiraceae bacterium]MBP9889096.1 hypothetical protein [Leptospiraceae bacterium]MBP9890218.1 hypothetical protein [Leptospiraceae bacterium]HRG47829.1 hypothetical protein [Leptospiraceae bacterium]
MSLNFDKLDEEIYGISKELRDVQSALLEVKKKQESNKSAKKEALVFIEKAEAVISKAERGKIKLSEEQVNRIKETLAKILVIFRS